VEYPSCIESGCLVENTGYEYQVVGLTYRVDGGADDRCYFAKTAFTGCLENPPEYPNHLVPGRCPRMMPSIHPCFPHPGMPPSMTVLDDPFDG